MNRVLPILAISTALAGCGLDEGEAELLVPTDVDLHWDASFNSDADGRVAIVPVDLMVYDGASGDPLADVVLDVQTDGEAWFVDPADIAAVDPEECVDCALAWDAFRDLYVELPDALDDVAINRLQTDADGLARVYVVVDAFPVDTEGFEALSVQVAMGDDGDAFLVVPR